VTLAGPDASQFSISSNSCSGANLAPATMCTLGVKFAPTGLGSRSATVTISSNGAGAPHAVALTGMGALRAGACANRRSGTARNNRMTGTSAGDRLLGLAGNDTLKGLAGADCLFGGRGNDRLNGGTGNDRLKGNAGNDTLTGGRGRNTYSGGRGNDTIKASNRSAEKVDCGPGVDTARVDRKDTVRNCEQVTRRR
jgi:Ca2+-binding RTX toxin-like protein